MDLSTFPRLSITRESLSQAPTTTGVYLFYARNEIIYIGKSVSLKARLISHWENAKVDTKESGIVHSSDTVRYIITDSELKALLLEAKLIQKYKPKYNVRWRDDKSNLYVKITVGDQYPKIRTVRKEEANGKSLYFGPFSSVHAVEDLLRHIRKVVPFCTQNKIGKHPCFYSKIGQCDPCPSYTESLSNAEDKQRLKRQYRNQIRAVIRIFEGKTDQVMSFLNKQLKESITNENYEKGIILRNAIKRFEYMVYGQLFGDEILDVYNQSTESLEALVALLHPYFPELSSLSHIECFDVSNLSQKEGTASLVVLTDGQIDRSQYKKFKIKNEKLHSDFEMLTEVLNRRFKHKDWKKPDLLIVDGGKPQVRIVAALLQQTGKTDIPLIGIAKRPDRIIINKIHFPMIRPAVSNLGFRMVQTIRDESHRFAKKYHIYLRSKKLFSQ